MATEIGGTYYPACIVNLLIRFDSAFNADARIEEAVRGPSAAPSVREIERNLLQPPGGGFSSFITGNEATAQRFISQPTLGKPLFDADANQKGSSILGRIPLRASVELNNLRKPGTFNLTFDYKDLPIDPRLVRSVGVEIFMDTVTADNFAEGIKKGRTSQVAPKIEAMRGFVPFMATPKNMVLKGVVDEWSVSHGTSGSTATISGRDMTGVLMNTPVTPKMLAAMTEKLNNPIDNVVRALVESVGAWTGYIEVKAVDKSEWPDNEIPFIADIAPLNLPVLLDEQSAKKGKKPTSRVAVKNGLPRISAGAHQDKLTVWDLITRYCNVVAAVPYFTIAYNEKTGVYKSVLLIRPQWGLYDYYSGRAETDWTSPTTESGGSAQSFSQRRKFPVRRLSYGRNIEELTLERKYQGITARAVEVVSYDSSSKQKGPQRLLSAISGLKKSYLEQSGVASQIAPLDSNPKAGEVPSGLSSQDEVLRVEVRGITDLNQLQKLADGLYEEIMRGETGGSVRTRTLASFGGDNEDPDLLRIRPRDPLELSIDVRVGSRVPSGDTNVLIAQAAKDVRALEAEIFDRTQDRNLARAVAYSSRNAVMQLQNAFRVNSVSFDWDVSSGISLSIDFHNYIVARDSVLGTSISAPGLQNNATAAGTSQQRPRV